jgi:ABC-type thiamine transport system ATPase subunit
LPDSGQSRSFFLSGGRESSIPFDNRLVNADPFCLIDEPFEGLPDKLGPILGHTSAD